MAFRALVQICFKLHHFAVVRKKPFDDKLVGIDVGPQNDVSRATQQLFVKRQPTHGIDGDFATDQLAMRHYPVYADAPDPLKRRLISQPPLQWSPSLAPMASQSSLKTLQIHFAPMLSSPRRSTMMASLNKAQDDFGCGLIQMYPDKGRIVDGNITCGKNFHGGEPLRVTGTMTQVR